MSVSLLLRALAVRRGSSSRSSREAVSLSVAASPAAAAAAVTPTLLHTLGTQHAADAAPHHTTRCTLHIHHLPALTAPIVLHVTLHPLPPHPHNPSSHHVHHSLTTIRSSPPSQLPLLDTLTHTPRGVTSHCASQPLRVLVAPVRCLSSKRASAPSPHRFALWLTLRCPTVCLHVLRTFLASLHTRYAYISTVIPHCVGIH